MCEVHNKDFSRGNNTTKNPFRIEISCNYCHIKSYALKINILYAVLFDLAIAMCGAKWQLPSCNKFRIWEKKSNINFWLKLWSLAYVLHTSCIRLAYVLTPQGPFNSSNLTLAVDHFLLFCLVGFTFFFHMVFWPLILPISLFFINSHNVAVLVWRIINNPLPIICPASDSIK